MQKNQDKTFVRLLKRAYWFSSTQMGIDPLKFFKLFKGLRRFVSDYYKFSSAYKGELEFLPCVNDWDEQGGDAQNEYFWIDLYVAGKIFKASPLVHVDVGSRIDGFIAHLACFREVRVFDVRPLTTQIPNVIFHQADFTSSDTGFSNYCDSASCLHVLEHFGLGRYGDEINPLGYRNGLKNLASLIKTGGKLYLAVPIGVPRVEFNGQNVFSPYEITSQAEQNKLELKTFATVSPSIGVVEQSSGFSCFNFFSKLRYTLGVFIFEKV